jgi:drug/metabolite transporter (DMT)-like permease
MTRAATPAPHPRAALAYTALLTAAAMFAATMIAGRAVREVIPPLTLSFWRWTLAAAVLGVGFRRLIAEHADVLRREWRLMAELAFLMIGASAVTMIAVHYTTAVNATVVNAMQPSVTALLVWMILHQPLRKVQMAGVAVALGGLAAIISHGRLSALRELRFNPGDLAMLLSVTGYSLYAVRLPRLPHGLPMGVSLFAISLAGALMLAPCFGYELATGQYWEVDWNTLAVVVFLGVGASILAVYAWNYGNRVVGPLRATMFVNLVPVFGALFGVLLLGEALHPYHFVGAGLVVGGVCLVVAGHPTAAVQPTA